MKKYIILTVLFVLSLSLALAQNISEYSYSTSYMGNFWDMSSGTTDLLATGTYYDDNSSAVTNIGFNFTFCGTAYSQFSINSNGQMQLGATQIANYLPSYGVGVALLQPLTGDNAIVAAGKVHYKVAGSAPNRMLIVEWVGFRVPYGSTGTTSNMQVWLHETSNRVNFIYGAMYANAATTRGVTIANGSTAGTIGNITTINTTPVWNTTGTSTVNTSFVLGNMTGLYGATDGSRRIFEFVPPVVGAPPNPATIVSPANGATGVLPAVTLNWGTGGGSPTGYKLFYGTNNPPTNIVNGTDLGLVTTYDPVDPNVNTTYYWKVVPYNAFGDAVGCPVWSFTSHNGAPTPLTPTNASTYVNVNNVTFTWDTPPFATGYKIKLGTSSGAGDVLNSVPATSPYVHVGPLNPGTTYYWSVSSVIPSRVDIPSVEYTFTTSPAGLVVIGNGTSNLNLPIYPYFGYTMSQSIYLQSELNTPGQRIEKIFFYWNGAGAGTVSNSWNIWMGHTAQTDFASTTSWVPWNTQTLVFSGEVALPATAGWIEIPLSSPFVYSNASNLVVSVTETEPGYDSSALFFYSTASATNRGLVVYNDTTPYDTASPVAGTQKLGFPNAMFEFGDIPAGAPDPVTLNSPADGATGLPKTGFNLTWSAALTGGAATTYGVYLATDEAEIYSQNYWETANTFFNPVTEGGLTFSYNDRYYWTIEAINGSGSAVVEPPQWFEIESDPSIVLPHTQNFDGATIPTGWTQSFSGGVTSNRWTVSTTVNAGGNLNEMKATWVSGTGITRLITPPINTTGIPSFNVGFNQFFDDYGPGITAKLQYSHDLTTWIDSGYSITSGGGNVTLAPSVLISGLSSPSTYLGWTLDGDHYQFDYWYIDNVTLTLPLAHDVATTSIDMAQVVMPAPLTPKATFTNYGINAETFTVQMQIGGGYTNVQTVTNLAVGSSIQVSFSNFTPTVNTSYNVTVTSQLGTDLNLGNDVLTGVLVALDLNYPAYCDVAYEPVTGITGPATFMLNNPATITDLPAANPWSGSFIAGADWMAGAWYGAQYDDGTLTTDNWWLVDNVTGAGTDLGDTGVGLTGVAYDPTNNILYGSAAGNLYTLNPATGVATLVGPFGPAWTGTMIGIAFNYMNMTLYGVDLVTDALYTIDPGTGTATLVGGLGIDLNYAQDIAFDGNTGNLYLAGYTGAGALYWIYTGNGSAWKIGNFQDGAEITGFAIPWGLGKPQVTIGADGTLSWDAIADATVYHVYGADDPYGAFTLLDSTTNTTWLDPNYPEGMKFYQVTADDVIVRANLNIQGAEVLTAKPINRSLTPVRSGVAKPQPK